MNHYKFEEGFNIRKLLMGISVLLLVVYGFFNARNLIMGPAIELFSPVQDIETKENSLLVKGVAKNVTFISLNEKPISIDKEGLFEEKLLLSPGSNIIQLKARDRFKKEITRTVRVYYKESGTDNI